ncbi:MAG TPA: sigma-54 dependent transcriptional regulator [Blastocatellia bacterium]|nr:sigma-54 dependent transcriptional regulator [Blastocatellia bacterium]
MTDDTAQSLPSPLRKNKRREVPMKVLVVDDEEMVRELVREAMEVQGYEAWAAASGRDALALGAENEFDLIFSDVVMDGLDGFDVLKGFRETLGSQAEIVLMTGQASVESAIEAVQHGANDYICKPFSISVLQAIATAVEQRRYPSKLIAVEGYKGPQQELLGNSPAMIEVVKTAARVAVTELPVMIRGESGTGKELIARLIHRKSLRSEKPFVAVNCGALPDTLLESELFGHTRGAFTGADSVRRGLFEEADGGTLLLDEVTETSPQFQVKLLRILQEGEFRPLGTNTKKRVNVRVLAATNRDPQSLIEQGMFRQDLLYRLQGVSIILPPLRERHEDIRSMALAFLSRYSTGNRRLSITKDAMLALERYNWPGNVRELKHLMQRLAALSSGIIRLEDLPAETVSTPRVASVMSDCIPEGDLPTLEQLESSYLLRVLSAVGGNKSRAAQVMGIDRKTLYRMIDRQTSASDNNKPKALVANKSDE